VIAGLETRELVEFQGLRESGTPGESGGIQRRRYEKENSIGCPGNAVCIEFN